MRRFLATRLLLAAFAALALAPAPALADGPPLTVPRAQLAAGLTCTPGLSSAKTDPVLLTPAFSSADESYGWNYLARLPKIGIPTCSISVPDNGYGDLQATAEYVVYAVRRMNRVSGRKVVLLGHQHGALDEFWALKFWPGIARKVTDLISLATPYNGTTSSAALCTTGPVCASATRQISKGSAFVGALSAAPLPQGVSFTSIASLNDTLITPQPEASHLDGASNIELQDICPGRQVSHFDILADAVAYDLVIDAMTHDGPADASRVPASACSDKLMPDADPTTAALANAFLPIFLSQNAAAAVAAEPPSRPYTARTAPVLRILTRRTNLVRGTALRLRVRCDSVGQTDCSGRLVLRSPRAGTVAAKRINLGSGKTRTVRLKATALREARGPSTQHLRVNLRLNDELGNAGTVARRVSVREASVAP